jgi:hypothetical protein
MGENIKNGRRYLILGQNSNIFSHFLYSPPLRETWGKLKDPKCGWGNIQETLVDSLFFKKPKFLLESQ